jgi:glycosyltransferase involved in cell wall biosynthesis
VVDDGSTDRTLAIARRFETAQLRVVTQKNQGAAAARNTALSLSRGDYIQYLDADDLMAPDKIAKQIDALGSSPNSRTLLSGSWGRFMYRYYRARFMPSALWCDLTPVEWLIRKMQFNLYMQTSAWLVSRELAEAAGPWDTRLLVDDDGEYFCRVLLASDRVQFVPEAKVYYRTSGPGSLSYIGRSDRKKVALLCSMKLHIQYIRSLEDSQRVREACVTYLQNWVCFFYPEREDLIKQVEEVAVSLGGKLQLPTLSWKIVWLSALFGRQRAKRAQAFLARIKWSLGRLWDRILFQIEGRRFRHSFVKS